MLTYNFPGVESGLDGLDSGLGGLVTTVDTSLSSKIPMNDTMRTDSL